MKIDELIGIYTKVSQKEKAIIALLGNARKRGWWVTRIEINQMEDFTETGNIEVLAWCTH